MRNVVAVITGLMGSGKTWLLSRLFNQPPPDLRTSTGIAERSFRGLLRHIIKISLSHWESFTYDQILEFLACLFHGESDEVHFPSKAKDAFDLPGSVPITSLSPPPSSPPTEVSSSHTQPASSTTPPTSTFATESLTMQSMVKKVKAPMSFISSNDKLDLIHMIDTGGQPVILETLPGLIHHFHLILLVLNLEFDLDNYPTVIFHEKGQQFERASPFKLSNRDIIMKLASTLQAKRSYKRKKIQAYQNQQSESQCFRLIVVATHRDCVPEGKLEARIKKFDLALRQILLPANNEELILFAANQIPFVLNLKDPDKEDDDQLDLIRSKVSDDKVGEVISTPGSFLMFEQLLMEHAGKEVKRDVLSLSECQCIGKRLKMKPEEIEVALTFFHQQFTLLYFRHVLPNLVFTRPQTPLDCVNEIVRFSYKVKSGEVKGIPGKLVSSLEDGIITEEILSHKMLTCCFIPGLYQPCDAIHLLCHMLTLAPLSHEVQSRVDCNNPPTSTFGPSPEREKREYLMMCLQKPISNKDLPQHLPPPSEIAPLVVMFTKNCVPLSCFSRTISCLLAMYNWKLSRADNGSPQCLAHNVVSLYTPQTPGQVVLADMGHSIQVHIKVDSCINPKSFPSICLNVKETVFAAIQYVFDILNLAGINVSEAFICPCLRGPPCHSASVYLFESQLLLRCSVVENSSWAAQNKHQVWLEAPVVEQKRPSLPKLFKLKIPLKVGAKFYQFGVSLLNDEYGELINVLESECNGKCEMIVCKILVQWVSGRGKTLSWKTLSDTLRECSLSFVADEINSTYM